MRKLIILFLILLIKIGKLEDKPKSTKLTVRFAEFFFGGKTCIA